ncbi:MAG: SgcJ/EcaC family oxidoreductase [Chloroflexi bacterium]|nr:SgcJ/EcaC family oxidoreductase [Chloroflexota bacterium]
MTRSDHQNTRPADEAAVRAVLGQLVAAWNRADGAAYGNLFTPDADYIDVTGTHTRGALAIGQLHQFLFNGPLKGSQLEGWDEEANLEAEIHFLDSGIALVIGGGASRLEGQLEAPEDRRSINTSVLIKRDGEWRIRAFQNNRVNPVYLIQSMPGSAEGDLRGAARQRTSDQQGEIGKRGGLA